MILRSCTKKDCSIVRFFSIQKPFWVVFVVKSFMGEARAQQRFYVDPVNSVQLQMLVRAVNVHYANNQHICQRIIRPPTPTEIPENTSSIIVVMTQPDIHKKLSNKIWYRWWRWLWWRLCASNYSPHCSDQRARNARPSQKETRSRSATPNVHKKHHLLDQVNWPA